jgi:UDP-N-acetylglucosamine--N-acetylmuramyl-(pentapeptide) pyrophosphoryl-undecaprenol N-acetylglucosamine transferase
MSVLESLEKIQSKAVQVIWQSGKNYYDLAKTSLPGSGAGSIFLHAFIDRMDLAYAAADVVVSRAGAGTISELCLVGKPCILVPSPNVAEDHQTRNALSLVERKAAIMVRDAEAREILFSQVFRIMDVPELGIELSQNIRKLAIPDSATRIVTELFEMIEEAHGTC